jgi:hypothetical protein
MASRLGVDTVTRFTIVHQEELAQVTDDLSWQARGLFLELLLAADYVTGMVPATSREQVRVWTGRSWSATANHLDELGKAGLVVESAAGIQVTVYPQVTDPRGEREVLRGKREQPRGEREHPRGEREADLQKRTHYLKSNKTTADGHRFVPGEGWIRIEASPDE